MSNLFSDGIGADTVFIDLFSDDLGAETVFIDLISGDIGVPKSRKTEFEFVEINASPLQKFRRKSIEDISVIFS